jgi:hypothetical protein
MFRFKVTAAQDLVTLFPGPSEELHTEKFFSAEQHACINCTLLKSPLLMQVYNSGWTATMPLMLILVRNLWGLSL